MTRRTLRDLEALCDGGDVSLPVMTGDTVPIARDADEGTKAKDELYRPLRLWKDHGWIFNPKSKFSSDTTVHDDHVTVALSETGAAILRYRLANPEAWERLHDADSDYGVPDFIDDAMARPRPEDSPGDLKAFLDAFEAAADKSRKAWNLERESLKHAHWSATGRGDERLSLSYKDAKHNRHTNTSTWRVNHSKNLPSTPRDKDDGLRDIVQRRHVEDDKLTLMGGLLVTGMFLKYGKTPDVPGYEDDGPLYRHPDDETVVVNPFKLRDEELLGAFADWFPVDDFEAFIDEVATVTRFTGLDMPATRIENNWNTPRR